MAFAVLAGLAALFLVMAAIAAAAHQAAMACEFASVVLIVVPAGVVTLLARPKET